MSVSTPVVNAGFKYINGMRLAYASATTMTVAAGECRNSTDVNDISIASAITINTAVSGAAGLDQGAMANNTFYAVYVVADSLKNNASTALISADLSSPLMPGGYNMFFRVGYVKSNGSAELLAFRQEGISLDRWMWYDVAIATDITAGASATFAAVDCSGGLPDLTISSSLNMLSLFTPTAANDTLELRPGSSSATNGYARASGAVAAVIETTNLVVPFDATTGVDYIVTGDAVALSVAAYLDQLG